MAADLAAALVASEDDRLLQAEALVRSYCGWHIAPTRTETLVLRGSGSAAQVLPTLHVTDVASITINGEVTASSSYEWDESGVLTSRYGRWFGRVEVTLTHGFPEPPAEVVAIVQAVAQRAVNNPGSKPREQIGPFGDTFSQAGFNQAPALALLDAEKFALGQYKLPSRP